MKLAAMFFLGILVGGEVINLAYRPILMAQAWDIHYLEEEKRAINAGVIRLRAGAIECEGQLKERDADEALFREALDNMGLLDNVEMMESKITLKKGGN